MEETLYTTAGSRHMLHRTMSDPLPLALRRDLEDVLGHLQYARRNDDLGRLALLTCWDVRRWARRAHEERLAQQASDLFTAQPHPSRAAFLDQVDSMIAELERIRTQTH